MNENIIQMLHKASSQTCQKEFAVKKRQPWENEELRLLIMQQNDTSNPAELKRLRQDIKKKRQTLLNDFY